MLNNIFSLLKVNLQLFDGEAAAAPAAGNQAESSNNISGSSRQKSGVKVVYGKQVNAQDAQQEGSDAGSQQQEGITLTPEQRKAEFEKLISGDYKDIFAERVQSIIDKRFKETKALEKQLETISPILNILQARYGTDDLKKLADAVMKDDAYLEQAAEEAGMTVEQYRRVLQLEAENKALKLRQQNEEAQRLARQQYDRWLQEAESLKETYPNLNLAEECSNPQFLQLLRAGVSVKAAYEVIHMDDIKTNVAKTTAKKVESKVTANIQARGSRPPENGVSNQSGVIVKNDVRQLTRQDRLEIARRVQRGEVITF